VVLPASMCAMIPMFRVLARIALLATSASLLPGFVVLVAVLGYQR
jgi:hypothetical protein